MGRVRPRSPSYTLSIPYLLLLINLLYYYYYLWLVKEKSSV